MTSESYYAWMNMLHTSLLVYIAIIVTVSGEKISR